MHLQMSQKELGDVMKEDGKRNKHGHVFENLVFVLVMLTVVAALLSFFT